MKTYLFLAAAFLSGACGALAASSSPPVEKQNEDTRILKHAYSENKVYKLDLYVKSVTALQFAPAEEVQSILIGDSASWEIVKLKSGNVVSVKPTVPSTSTNMTIYTDKRVYSFELNSAPEREKGPSVYRSIFSYPPEPKPKAAAEPEIINSDYMFSGTAAFRPKWVQDNGRQTTFFLPKNAPRPVIFKVGADKKEELINSRTVDDRIIVDGTSSFWVLRIGDQMICIATESGVQRSGHPVAASGGRNAL